MSERDQILAWMKGQLATGKQAVIDAKDGSRRQRDLAAGVVVLTNVIASIEAEAHLQEEG